jgi:hypothetical protein
MTEHLKQEGLYFAGLPLPAHTEYCTHFYGMTRRLIHPDDPNHGNVLEVEDYVRQKLTEYLA